MPTVSIIIATYNSAATIRTAIQSVLDMSYPDWELLVMDGASKDETCSIVREYEQQDSRIHLYSEPDTGIYDAFNKGWHKAQGTWVHYLGSDDTMTTDGLAALLKAPVADDVDVVSGHCWAMKVDGQRKQITSHGFYGCHQGKLTRRSAIAEMGGFNQQNRILADMDLYFRMRNAGRKAVNTECYVANFMMEGNSQSWSQLMANARERYSIYKNDREEHHPLLHTISYTTHTCLSIIYRKMRKSLLFTALLGSCLPLAAQSSLTTDIAFEFSGGTGDYNAFYTTVNRHGTSPLLSNSIGLRAALVGEAKYDDWKLGYGLDVVGLDDPYTPFFVQQLYGRVQWKDLYFEIGQREYPAAIRNQRLSSGSLLWSGNSRPIPQVRLGTEGFIDFPGTQGWLQVMLDGDYGLFMDDSFLEQRYEEYNPGGNTLTGYAQSFITTGAWHHQKRMFLRTNPDKPFVFTFGMEHAVQFGGTTINHVNNTIMGKLVQRVTPKQMLKVFIPSGGDATAAVGDQNFIYGNHLGNMTLQMGWNINRRNSLSAYVENLFEDGSGFCKRNGWDGLWGIEYKNTNNSFVTGVVLEYLQTTDQSGAVHWAPQDHMDEMTGEARGADEYYNNYFYCGYAHFGQPMGTPMLKAPIYNKDSYLRFTDNRVQAWHAGIEGNIFARPATEHTPASRFDYRCLVSYRNAYGTMAIPSAFIRHDLSFLTEVSYSMGQWHMTAAYGQDNGSLMGDNNTFNISIKYHGKIL